MVQTKFNAGMTCAFVVISGSFSTGCSGAIERILNKVEGVSTVETNVEAKSVVVDHDASVTPDLLLGKLMKWSKATGKEVSLA